MAAPCIRIAQHPVAPERIRAELHQLSQPVANLFVVFVPVNHHGVLSLVVDVRFLDAAELSIHSAASVNVSTESTTLRLTVGKSLLLIRPSIQVYGCRGICGAKNSRANRRPTGKYPETGLGEMSLVGDVPEADFWPASSEPA
jgi:hypothetical protein